MRVDITRLTSQEVEDAYVHQRAYLPGFAVLLDGYKVETVVALDTNEGWVEHYELNEKGTMFFDKGGRPQLRRDRGHVTLMLPELDVWTYQTRSVCLPRRGGGIEVINPQPPLVRS